MLPFLRKDEITVTILFYDSLQFLKQFEQKTKITSDNTCTGWSWKCQSVTLASHMCLGSCPGCSDSDHLPASMSWKRREQ